LGPGLPLAFACPSAGGADLFVPDFDPGTPFDFVAGGGARELPSSVAPVVSRTGESVGSDAFSAGGIFMMGVEEAAELSPLDDDEDGLVAGTESDGNFARRSDLSEMTTINCFLAGFELDLAEGVVAMIGLC